MNQATRDTIDTFITSIYGAIGTAQDSYKATNRDDDRYPDGRFFNETPSHAIIPEDATLTAPDATWTNYALPATLPCSISVNTLEWKNNMGWLISIDYIDDSEHYRKTIDTFGIMSIDWIIVDPT
jgi:hypothetical protein